MYLKEHNIHIKSEFVSDHIADIFQILYQN